MPNAKVIISSTSRAGTGLTLYHRIFRVVDGYGLCNTHNAFEATPTDPKITATEIGSTGVFRTSYNGCAFDDGEYIFDLVNSAQTSVYADGGSFECRDDLVIMLDTLDDAIATVDTNIDTLVTRVPAEVAPASTALSTATWTGTRAGYIDNLSGGAAALASNCDAKSSDIKAKTDLIVTGGATATGVSAVETKVDTLLVRVHATLPTFPSDPADASDIAGEITASETAILAGLSAWPGSGGVSVDEDTGGTDNLRYLDSSSGLGIQYVNLYAFLTTDWAAGSRDLRNYPTGNCKGRAVTDVNGRWVNPMKLAAGAYTLYAEDSNAHTFTPVAVTVS